MTETIDLDAYCARIGYGGTRAPTLETLRALHLAHLMAIAFENLDPVLGRPVKLDLVSLEQKLVHGRRGGYCYEHNILFLLVLQALGYDAVGLSARVLRDRNVPFPPRSHMLIKIELAAGAVIADVGFGGPAPTLPLRLYSRDVQNTQHGSFRLFQVANEFEMQAHLGDAWQSQYRFSLEVQMLQDYEAPNWYRATHPQSPFVTNLVAVRPLADRHLGLRNNRFTVRHPDGRVDRQVLTQPRQIVDLLEDAFGIALPGARAGIEESLARFIPE